MSKNKVKAASKVPIENQKQIVPLNSKYTYNHVSHFHQTILTILGNKDLARLSVSDLKKIAYFIQLIVRILELPHNTYQTEEKNNHPYVKLKEIGEMRHSKKCLRALVKWIEQLVSKKYLTLEALLDEYYNNFRFAQQIHTTETILPNRNDLSGKHPSTQISDNLLNTPMKMRTSVHTLNNIIKPPD